MFVSFIIGCLAMRAPSDFLYWDISKFNIDSSALVDNEEIGILYHSDGPDDNQRKKYYYHYIAISKESGDTVNILCSSAMKLVADTLGYDYVFLNEDNLLNKVLQMKKADIKKIELPEDIKDAPRKEITKVVRDPAYDYIADNNFPTLIGSFIDKNNELVADNENLIRKFWPEDSQKEKAESTCIGDCENGLGEKEWEDGTIQKGTWKNGQLNGEGSLQMGKYSESPGDTYQGEFLDGQMHGKGTFYNAKTDVTYVGVWEDSHKVGKGTATFGPNSPKPGVVIEGVWKDGEIVGNTVFKSASGIRYEGEIQNGGFVGDVRIDFSNGAVYVGELINGKPDGKGVLTYPSGEVYSGPMKDGKPHGKGVFTFSDGSTCKGKWKNGQNPKLDEMWPYQDELVY